ncbi:hypothetical protein H6G98_07435 [Nostoc sp. FACHB-857]|nr:hypothetical protein [Nostoc sp. FACHB-857]
MWFLLTGRSQFPYFEEMGDWGLGTGDWGLGTGDWGLGRWGELTTSLSPCRLVLFLCPMPNAPCPMP